MKKIILFATLLIVLIYEVNGQKKYSLGFDAVFFSSLTNNTNKKELFRNDVGAQIGFRKNLSSNNFLTLGLTATNGNKNIYNFQTIRIGIETGGLNQLKNMFVLSEFVFRRFTSKSLGKTTFNIAPSLGIGYNLKIANSLMLRGYNNFEYNIPNKIVSAFNNFGLGLHYCFNK